MTEWIVAISSGISAASIVALCIQIVLSARQNRLLLTQVATDHERSRRENAVKLIFDWSQLLDIKTSVARRIAESLNDEQARALWSGDSLNLPLGSLVFIQICLESQVDSEKSGYRVDSDGVHLTGIALKELKWNIVRYLNLLEAVFASRRFHTADREIIDEQFGYLVSAVSGKDVLGSIRRAAGGPDALPAIEEFAREQQAKANQLRPGKPPVFPVAGQVV